MSSPHLEENLSAYLAGALTEAESRAAESHLKECAQCQKELDALRQLDVMLSQAGSLEPSSGFLRGVMNRLDDDRKVIAFRSRRVVAWVALAAVVAFFVFVIGYRQMHPSSTMAHHPNRPKQQRVAPQQTAPDVSTVEPQQTAQLSAEDAELIANLDMVENMDVIENYDNIENLDVALLESTEEKAQ